MLTPSQEFVLTSVICIEKDLNATEVVLVFEQFLY